MQRNAGIGASWESKMGVCSLKELQAQDSVGQPVVERAKGS